MEITRFQDAEEYTLSDHEQVTAKRLQGGDATGAGFVLVGHSHFPPGAIVPMGAAPFGRVYVVVEGALTVEQADGVRHRLSMWDSVFVPSGEARAVTNETEAPAVIIVVTPPSHSPETAPRPHAVSP